MFKQEGVKIPKDVQEQLKSVETLIHKENPVGAIKLEKKIKQELKPEFQQYISKLRDEIDQLSKQAWQQTEAAPEELRQSLQDLFLAIEELEKQGDQLFQEGEWEDAVKTYKEAEQELMKNFQSLMDQYKDWMASLPPENLQKDDQEEHQEAA